MGKFILIGAVIGSLVGMLMNITMATGIIVGAIIGGIIGTWTKKNQSSEASNNHETMQLREEELDIKKERVQTGEVKIHKEVVEDQKTITIPVRREEMVIEAGSEEELRIPLKEEEIDISKHPVQLNEVIVKKHQVEDVQHIKENLKKETVVVESEGQAEVVEEEKQ
ncbi:YsnF/AvaK domain-containing protein [Alkalihalophilus lindianensis]|uniref:YsnF/AvaK domain-containing protein n=1 Tax=Alkalihalophilus lindianensis TaxID=1630542 RepID=A0ABU3XDY9_9BACI|nr:YsnF/AvaK domain-containing protein [Alkalihalophilus lindianensis]MDV2686101.1 YsnF/AvaK domain-containing protein [Alkalihalophilus lindianensis]